SCQVKGIIEMVFVSHAISSDDTIMAAFNKLPRPRLGTAYRSIWFWLSIQLFELLPVGGIVGGVGIALNMIFPSIPVVVWVTFTAVAAALLVYRGQYQSIEKIALVMIGLFTLMTFASVFSLQFTEFAITRDNLAE